MVKKGAPSMEQEVTTQGKKEVTSNEQTRPGRTYVPNVDIYETPESLWLWADMPGVEESSLEVHVADGVLSLEGRVALQEYDSLSPVYTEYNIGNYARRFSLSNEIDIEHIKARMTNGVLELELPKAERAKPKRIAVSVG
jgi:HSP20 family protein